MNNKFEVFYLLKPLTTYKIFIYKKVSNQLLIWFYKIEPM